MIVLISLNKKPSGILFDSELILTNKVRLFFFTIVDILQNENLFVFS